MANLITGPWEILDIQPYPCPKDGFGEPNPPAAFIGPPGSEEAVALVFGYDDSDPYDLQNHANLIVAAPQLRDACKFAEIILIPWNELTEEQLAVKNGLSLMAQEAGKDTARFVRDMLHDAIAQAESSEEQNR